MPLWHLAQVVAMLARWMLELRSLCGSSWCEVWQSVQVADTTRPLSLRAFPCTLWL